jgi:hypothetical protein
MHQREVTRRHSRWERKHLKTGLIDDSLDGRRHDIGQYCLPLTRCFRRGRGAKRCRPASLATEPRRHGGCSAKAELRDPVSHQAF